MHPAIRPHGVAVITGAAMGIGYALANRLLHEGMAIVLFDKDAVALESAMKRLSHSTLLKAVLRAVEGDVTDDDALIRLKEAADELGQVSLLVNNAAVMSKAGPWETSTNWRQVNEVNFWAVLKLQQLFVEQMLTQSGASAIVNVGSKEGITTPPGNAAYAVSKAAVRVLTEQLSHELRGRSLNVTAHLLIPGYTFTPMNFPGMNADTEKPEAPWTASQVADRLVEGMSAGQFYIFCEDNDVTHALDQRRMQWSADDLILGRPALSRWHPEYREAFATYCQQR